MLRGTTSGTGPQAVHDAAQGSVRHAAGPMGWATSTETAALADDAAAQRAAQRTTPVITESISRIGHCVRAECTPDEQTCFLLSSANCPLSTRVPACSVPAAGRDSCRSCASASAKAVREGGGAPGPQCRQRAPQRLLPPAAHALEHIRQLCCSARGPAARQQVREGRVATQAAP